MKKEQEELGNYLLNQNNFQQALRIDPLTGSDLVKEEFENMQKIRQERYEQQKEESQKRIQEQEKEKAEFEEFKKRKQETDNQNMI